MVYHLPFRTDEFERSRAVLTITSSLEGMSPKINELNKIRLVKKSARK